MIHQEYDFKILINEIAIEGVEPAIIDIICEILGSTIHEFINEENIDS